MKDRRPWVIAIDGSSSSGKSSLARLLAARLGYLYIDTGAMYRAVSLYFLEQSISVHQDDMVQDALFHIDIDLRHIEGQLHTFLNDRDVSDDIRSMEVSSIVSEVAAISKVRRKLVEQQRLIGQDGGIVMDGRDIGTVVFPDADLKIFLHCELDQRVTRRYEELLAKGRDITRLEVEENLKHRDHIDSTRLDSPLTQADDAHLVDNTQLTMDQTIETCLALIAGLE